MYKNADSGPAGEPVTPNLNLSLVPLLAIFGWFREPEIGHVYGNGEAEGHSSMRKRARILARRSQYIKGTLQIRKTAGAR